MSLLVDHPWLVKYTPDDGDLVALLYVPALRCATRYDRLTGFFSASALALAASGGGGAACERWPHASGGRLYAGGARN
ncbi:MAG: hypothetical protein FD152_1043 [Xanthobacteraceae bacterium]|nr:MAG: hypothetical protein FD152_1043 [Xanthobacteraceae bacterium]